MRSLPLGPIFSLIYSGAVNKNYGLELRSQFNELEYGFGVWFFSNDNVFREYFGIFLIGAKT